MYEGQFKRGKKHGSGVMKYPDGSTFEEVWEDGVLISHRNDLERTETASIVARTEMKFPIALVS